jgi:hypothetical protein
VAFFILKNKNNADIIKPMKIFNTIEKIDKQLDKLDIIMQDDKLFLIFNKKNAPYLAILRPLINRDEVERMGLKQYNNTFKLTVYDAKDLMQYPKHVAKMNFAFNSTQDGVGSIYLSNINVNQEHSKKQLGGAMLKVLDLCAHNLGQNTIQGYAFAHNYLEDKEHSLIKFYENHGYAFAGNDFEKILDKEYITNIKHVSMNFPTKNRTYTVIIPQKHLVASGFKDNQQAIEM